MGADISLGYHDSCQDNSDSLTYILVFFNFLNEVKIVFYR